MTRRREKSGHATPTERAPSRARNSDRQIAGQRWLGLVACAAGFVVIGIGWAGAARETCVDCQLPYLLSGGAVGVGLLIFGVGMLVMAQVRTEGRRLGSRLERMIELSSTSATVPLAMPDGMQATSGNGSREPSASPASPPGQAGETTASNVIARRIVDDDLSAAEREAFGEDPVAAARQTRRADAATMDDDGAVTAESPESQESPSGLLRRRRPRRRKGSPADA